MNQRKRDVTNRENVKRLLNQPKDVKLKCKLLGMSSKKKRKSTTTRKNQEKETLQQSQALPELKDKNLKNNLNPNWKIYLNNKQKSPQLVIHNLSPNLSHKFAKSTNTKRRRKNGRENVIHLNKKIIKEFTAKNLRKRYKRTKMRMTTCLKTTWPD